MEELARIEKVDLRKAWPNEAVYFTPWLAKHLSELGEALGLEDLELQGQEVPVGGFSLDILASDRSVGNVVIENQLQATDHDHLGKLLTYAAGRDANVIVWIARKFSDEHRAALEFLNDRTGEDTKFFGVVVELWSIDNSRPAVNFDLVATPNSWSKETKSQRGEVSDRNRKYQAFFQPLLDRLREDSRFTHARKDRRALPEKYITYAAGPGLGKITYQTIFRAKVVKVEVIINKDDAALNEQLFDQLEERKGEIESQIEGDFEWNRLDGKRSCRISTVRSGSIDDDEETLEEIREWMIDRLIAFERVFGPILAELAG